MERGHAVVPITQQTTVYLENHLYTVLLSTILLPGLGKRDEQGHPGPNKSLLVPFVFELVPAQTDVRAEPVYIAYPADLSLPKPAMYCCAPASRDSILLGIQPDLTSRASSSATDLAFYEIYPLNHNLALRKLKLHVQAGYRGFAMTSVLCGLVALHRFGTGELVFLELEGDEVRETDVNISSVVASTAHSPRQKEIAERLKANPIFMASSFMQGCEDSDRNGHYTALMFARNGRDTVVIRIQAQKPSQTAPAGAREHLEQPTLSIVPPPEDGENIPLDAGVCVLFNRYALISGGVNTDRLADPATTIPEEEDNRMMDPLEKSLLKSHPPQPTHTNKSDHDPQSPNPSSQVQETVSDQKEDPDTEKLHEFFKGWKLLDTCSDDTQSLEEVVPESAAGEQAPEPSEESMDAPNPEEDHRPEAGGPTQQFLLLDLKEAIYLPVQTFYRDFRYLVEDNSGGTDGTQSGPNERGQSPHKEYRVANSRSFLLSLPVDPAMKCPDDEFKEEMAAKGQQTDESEGKGMDDPMKGLGDILQEISPKSGGNIDIGRFLPIFDREGGHASAEELGHQAVRSFYRTSPLAFFMHTTWKRKSDGPLPKASSNSTNTILFLGGEVRGRTRGYQYAPGSSLAIPLDLVMAALSSSLGEDVLEECLDRRYALVRKLRSKPGESKETPYYKIYGDGPWLCREEEEENQQTDDKQLERENARKWYKEKYGEKPKTPKEKELERLKKEMDVLQKQQLRRKNALNVDKSNRMLDQRIKTMDSKLNDRENEIRELERELAQNKSSPRMRAILIRPVQ